MYRDGEQNDSHQVREGMMVRVATKRFHEEALWWWDSLLIEVITWVSLKWFFLIFL